MSKKKIAVIAGSIIILLGGGAAVRQSQVTKQEAAVQTAKVSRETFVKTISSSGKVQADISVDLKFQTSGKLTWVGVKEGDSVSKYQAIATLDTREVQKNLEKALRDYSSERNDFEETWRVTYQGRAKPTDALNDTVKRILEKNQWDLESAVLDVELKHLALEYSTLVTPIAGIVTHIDTPVAGVNITPATAVFSVSDPSSLVFEANVDETDIGALSIGQTASVTLDAYPDATYSGTISYISLVAEQSSGGSTVFPVKIVLGNQEGLRIGLNGDVTIETSAITDALVVPTDALREDDDGMYVFVKKNTTYTKARVTTGPRTEQQVVITKGLQEGDLVVVKGFSNIPQ